MNFTDRIIALKPEARLVVQKRLAMELLTVGLMHARAQHYENRAPEDFTHEANMQMTVDFTYAMTHDADFANKVAHGLAGDEYPLREGFLTSMAALAIAKRRFPKITVRATDHKVKNGPFKGCQADHVSVRASFMQRKDASGAPVSEGSSINWNTDVAMYQAIVRMLYAEVMRLQVNVTSIISGLSPIALCDATEEAAKIKWPLTQMKKKLKAKPVLKNVGEFFEEQNARLRKKRESHERRHKAWAQKNSFENSNTRKKNALEKLSAAISDASSKGIPLSKAVGGVFKGSKPLGEHARPGKNDLKIVITRENGKEESVYLSGEEAASLKKRLEGFLKDR